MANPEFRCPHCDFEDTRTGFGEAQGVFYCPDCRAVLGVSNW